MIYFGWWAFGQYVWYLNSESYFNTIGAILDCAIANGVDSTFANEDWMTNQWGAAFENYLIAEGEILGLWWHPALVIATMLPYPPFIWVWTYWAQIAWIVANVILGLDRQAMTLSIYAGWLGLGGGEEELEE